MHSQAQHTKKRPGIPGLFLFLQRAFQWLTAPLASWRLGSTQSESGGAVEPVHEDAVRLMVRGGAPAARQVAGMGGNEFGKDFRDGRGIVVGGDLGIASHGVMFSKERLRMMRMPKGYKKYSYLRNRDVRKLGFHLIRTVLQTDMKAVIPAFVGMTSRLI